MNESTWTYRMAYTPHLDFIDWAAEAGANWAVVDSFGHLGHASGGLRDDVPVLLEAEPRIADLRRPYADQIDADVRRVQGLLDRARSHGMNAALACYQVSLPAEVEQVLPELWHPPVREIQRHVPESLWKSGPCLSDDRLCELISETVREALDRYTGLDAFIYSFHESMFNVTVSHRCEQCRDIPYAAMVRRLYDAIRAGVDAAREAPRIFVRCWGMLHSEGNYFERPHLVTEWGLRPPGKPVPHYAPDIEPLRYSPARDFPEILDALRGEDVVFVSKISYGDFNLGQLTNPWIGGIQGFDHIGEISFEHAQGGRRVFTLIADQVERFAKTAREAGLAGLALVPTSWGARGSHPINWRYAARDRAGLGLNAGNFACAAAAFDAEPNARDALKEWLEGRYGVEVPHELADLLARTEAISAAMFSWNGVCYLMNFDLAHHWAVPDSLNTRRSNAIWYASHFDDGLARIEPTAENVASTWRAHDDAFAAARELPELAEPLLAGLPAEAAGEIRDQLLYYRDWMEITWLSQRIMLRLWQWEKGTAPVTPQTTEELLAWESRRTFLAANSPHLKGMWFGHAQFETPGD